MRQLHDLDRKKNRLCAEGRNGCECQVYQDGAQGGYKAS